MIEKENSIKRMRRYLTNLVVCLFDHLIFWDLVKEIARHVLLRVLKHGFIIWQDRRKLSKRFDAALQNQQNLKMLAITKQLYLHAFLADWRYTELVSAHLYGVFHGV